MPRKSTCILLFALAFAVPTTADDFEAPTKDVAKLVERYLKLVKQNEELLRSLGFVRRTYPVADLASIHSLPPPATNDRPTFRRFNGWNYWKWADDPESQPLIDHLTRTIDPPSWSEAGGRGTIWYDKDQRALFVTASPEVHAQIPLALAQLEQGLGRGVIVEVRSWRISAALAQRLADVGIPCNLVEQDVVQEPHIVCLPDHCLKYIMDQVQEGCDRGTARVPGVTLLQDRDLLTGETHFCLTIDEAMGLTVPLRQAD